MTRFAALFLIICLSVNCFADILDIQFSPGPGDSGGTPGEWVYDGVDTFSFTQIIDIDLVEGGITDALYQEQVFIPDLVLSAGNTVVTPQDFLEIKDGATVLLRGTLETGDFHHFFTTAALYTQYTNDLTVTYINNTISSDFLDTVSVGDEFDFSLTLQGEHFADMIDQGLEGHNGFSGQMNFIPEPATLFLLGLGSMVLMKKRRQ
jgi:hypothetical protein